MKNMNFLSGRDKELHEMAERLERAIFNHTPFYMDAEDFADLADWYAMHQQYEGAQQAIEYGLTLHPNHPAILTESAYLYFDIDEFEKAREIADKLPADIPEAKVLKARILLEDGDLGACERLLDTLEDKSDLANIVDIAYMYLDGDWPMKAWKWLQMVEEEDKNSPSYLGVLGDYYYRVSNYANAEKCYNTLLDHDPYSAPCWMGLANCYFEQNKYDKAIEACDYALISEEECAEAYTIKGHCFYALGNEEEAIKCYREARDGGGIPDSFYFTFMGMHYFFKSQWEQAYRYMEMAIAEMDEENFTHKLTLPGTYSNAAYCLFKMGKKRKSAQFFKKAHELAPNDADVYLMEGKVHLSNGKAEKGAAAWQEALRLAPEAYTWQKIASFCIDLGNMEFAKYALEQVKKMEPDFHGINEQLATLCLTMHDKEGFQKYNKLCSRPISKEDLEFIQNKLEADKEIALSETVKEILKKML
ncbi:MAG: tetratricopeptide repeat protein [Bacteroides sp.]|nr:tetratricopeptide repeat protein [Bacteroides sp.]